MDKAFQNMTEQEIIDKRQAAIHEAGHCIVAQHFGIRWDAVLTRAGDATIESRAFVGQTRMERSEQATAFRFAVIGWAGPVAEAVAHEDDTLDERPLDEWPKASLDDFSAMAFDELDEYSQTDRLFIEGHNQRFRALKTAWKIVVERRVELMAIANQLLQTGECWTI